MGFHHNHRIGPNSFEADQLDNRPVTFTESWGTEECIGEELQRDASLRCRRLPRDPMAIRRDTKRAQSESSRSDTRGIRLTAARLAAIGRATVQHQTGSRIRRVQEVAERRARDIVEKLIVLPRKLELDRRRSSAPGQARQT